ncbi:MAG TPA: ribonuclease P protein component [Isosphaeraceae bacterium]|jgi:ribonuclease P protein component|nr:ribonuclease P protein component [Isosphaeraceae bacterium]
MNQSFRPHERIKDTRDFRRAFDRRKSAGDDWLVVYGAENGLGHARLGLSVSKKKLKTAVARNRFKRLVREAFRRNKAELPTGIDLVVVPRGPGLTFEAAMRSLPALARAVARRLGAPAGPPPEGPKP